MAIAQIVSGSPVELVIGLEVTTGSGGSAILHSYQTVLAFTEAERNALGLYTIVEPSPPAFGQQINSTSLSFSGGVVTRVAAYGAVAVALARTLVHQLVAIKLQGYIATGYLVSGYHVQIDAASIANLNSMMSAAERALNSMALWPDDYARGWISIEGPRIPMAQPDVGLALGQVCLGYYAAIVQYAHDLDVAIDAAANTAAVLAINTATGWPTGPGSASSATIQPTTRVLFRLRGANMNTTADQVLEKVGVFTNYTVDQVLIGEVSASLTAAVGGIYTAASKGGTAVVAASTTYKGLTATSKPTTVPLTATGADGLSAGLFLSLTTPQGSAATATFVVKGTVWS